MVYGIFIDGTVRPSWEEITEEQFEFFTIESQKIEEEETISQKLDKIGKQLNSMEESLNYLISLQTAQYAESGNLLESNE